MSDLANLELRLKSRLSDLVGRAEAIEDDLRHKLDADSSEQAVDEALTGVNDVLREEIREIREALLRIENGTYGICAKCGSEIGEQRLEALPTATRCITCA